MGKVKEYDANGVEVIRDLTPEEIQNNLKDQQAHEAQLAEIEDKRSKKIALLTKLGITDDEAKLLLS